MNLEYRCDQSDDGVIGFRNKCVEWQAKREKEKKKVGKRKNCQKVILMKIPEMNRLVKRRFIESDSSQESDVMFDQQTPNNQHGLGKPIQMNYEEMTQRIRELKEAKKEDWAHSAKGERRERPIAFLSDSKENRPGEGSEAQLKCKMTTKSLKIIGNLELEFIDSFNCYFENSSLLDIWNVYYGEDYMNYIQMKVSELDMVSDCWTTDEKEPSINLSTHELNETSKQKGEFSRNSDWNRVENQRGGMISILDQELGKMIYQVCTCQRNDNKKLVHSCLAKNSPKIEWKMRIALIDWMKELSSSYSLKKSTFHLGVSILDEYLSKVEGLEVNGLQMIGALCLILGSKCEVDLN